MAIKLLGVRGNKILPDEHDAQTQDFVMINHPVFFLNDPKRYYRLQKAKHTLQTLMHKLPSIPTNGNEYLDRFVTLLVVAGPLGIKGTKRFREVTGSKITSPLTTPYWSMSAYRLGNPPNKLAIKFLARPTRENPITSSNYLREAMKNQLATDEWQFDFKMQRQPPGTSVEDTMVEWQTEEESVATITIPRQEFSTPARDQFCEGLSFTPWHALQEHRPLGAVNRMRRAAYEEISKLRHELNGVQRREPTEQDVP